MVSTIDLIVKTFIDRLKWITTSKDEIEMKQRIAHSISFFEGCLTGSSRTEIIMSPQDLEKLIKRKSEKE